METLRKEIIGCLVLCEAEIDFGDTEEIDEGLVQKGRLTSIRQCWCDLMRIQQQKNVRNYLFRSYECIYRTVGGARLCVPEFGSSSLENQMQGRVPY